MDYKKLYEKAVERAKTLTNSGFNDFDFVKHIFPELAESEDEKIKKELISCIKQINYDNLHTWNGINLNVFIAWLEKQGEQKPLHSEWSEEDENIVLGIEQLCNCASLLNIAPDKIDNTRTWLKSLKNRVQPQNSSVTDEELAQAKKEAYNEALDKIEYNSGEPTFDDGWSAAIWYLRKRNAQPQNTWKPSGFHLECISDAIAMYQERGINAIGLKEILEELKKLKEE